MKLAVISPESHDPREIAVVHALFAAGLERYHLRKPLWSADDLETYLRNFFPAERARMIVHSHHVLCATWALGGIHERDDHPPTRGETASSPSGLRTHACHDLACLRAALGRYDAVMLSPVFPSISKSGYAPDGRIDLGELKTLLRNRTTAQRRAAVFALGGIDADTTARCREFGFDGVAVLGAVWNAEDPLRAFREIQHACVVAGGAESDPNAAHPVARPISPLRRERIMCLTQDGLSLSHIEQTRRLCEVGARWVQLRMKEAPLGFWLQTARAVGEICRAHDAIFIVNDSVEVALESGADGVHLGKTDREWVAARRLLGPDLLLGGTVNNSADAERARVSGCLDYAGVGPWRFTSSKKNLSPVLGPAGVRKLVAELGGLPAWAIGGIQIKDIPEVDAAGAAGVAVSSALYRNGKVEENLTAFRSAWRSERATHPVTTL